MNWDTIDELLNRDDVCNSNDEVFGLYLQEKFENDPNLWKELLVSWVADTTLWIYDGDLRDLDKIVNESGGRFTAPEVALELGNLYICKAPLIKWLVEKKGPGITIPAEDNIYIYGKQKLCNALSLKSFNAVVNRVKKAGMEFKYNDKPQPQPGLKISEIVILQSLYKKKND